MIPKDVGEYPLLVLFVALLFEEVEEEDEVSEGVSGKTDGEVGMKGAEDGMDPK